MILSQYDMNFLAAMRIVPPELCVEISKQPVVEQHDCYASVSAQVSARRFICATCGAKLSTFDVACRLSDWLLRARQQSEEVKQQLATSTKTAESWESLLWGLIGLVALAVLAWGWPRG